MGAVRMRVQTADISITIHTSEVNQLMSCEMKSCMFVRKMHNIVLSSEKVISSKSGEKKAQIKHRLQAKTAQNSSKQICWWILM